MPRFPQAKVMESQTLPHSPLQTNFVAHRCTSHSPSFCSSSCRDLQGTSMEGPIPPTISELKNLQELRIYDLKGPTTFHGLKDLKSLVRLWVETFLAIMCRTRLSNS